MPRAPASTILARMAVSIPALAFCLAAAMPNREAQAMTTIQNQAIQLLVLPPERYAGFDAALKQALQERLGALVEESSGPSDQRVEPPPVLVLGAPPEVVVKPDAAAPPVPVLVGSVRSGTREWQVNFRTNLHLFLRRLDGSMLTVLQPLRDLRRGGRELKSGAGSPPGGVEAASMLSDVMRVDLAERLGALPAPGRYAVTAVAVDWLSNTVPIRIAGPAPAARAEDAPTPYGGVRHVLDPRVGLDAQVDVTPAARGSEPVRMRAALSVPQEAVSAMQPGGADPAWTGHVVLIAPDEEPLTVPLRVPAARVSDPAAAPRYNVVFQLDLRAAVPGLSGRWLVYLEAGTRWLGPYPVQITP